MVPDLLSLAGRVALVTGAGQGVGAQIARHFAAHEASAVVVNDFYRERAEAVAAELVDSGTRALAVQCDVTDFDAVRRMVSEAEEAVGPIDILVNNAGNAGPDVSIVNSTPFWETTPEEWMPWVGVRDEHRRDMLWTELNRCA